MTVVPVAPPPVSPQAGGRREKGLPRGRHHGIQVRILPSLLPDRSRAPKSDAFPDRNYRLFVTGLAPTVDDVRLYLAFQNCGKVVEAHVAKPGEKYKRSEFPLAVCCVSRNGNNMAAFRENFRRCDPCEASGASHLPFPNPYIQRCRGSPPG